MKNFFKILLVPLLFLAGCSNDAPSSAKLAKPAEILWDKDGVPHIYADNGNDVAYAFGRAQMQMHGELLVRLYAQARGRAAEYYGPSFTSADGIPINLLEVDKLVHTMRFPQRAQEWNNFQTPRMQAYLSAFVKGLNDEAPRQTLSPEARAVFPLQSNDVLAHTLRTFFSYLSGSTTTGAPNCALIYPNGDQTSLDLIGGSNGWALAGSKTISGKPMLLANPHLLWGGAHTWFEAHFQSPDYDIYGATLVGLPVMRIGFNQRLGWVHTVNAQDGCDLYELKVDKDRYFYDGSWRNFDTQNVSIKVKQANGASTVQSLAARQSVHGAVFEKDGKHYALRIVGVAQLSTPGVLEQWWDMAQARDFSDFKSVVGRMQNPYHNIIYADAQDNIWSVYGGLTPKRSTGDANFWAQALDGSRADLVWDSALSLAELPQVQNPAVGWVQNSNSVPWFMSKPALAPTAYPSYLAPAVAPNLREQRGIELIESTPKFSLESLATVKHDTHALLADRVLPDLIGIAQLSGLPNALRAANVLSAWDKRTLADSKGAALFQAWAQAYQGAGGIQFTQPASFSAPYTSPQGLADPEMAIGVLLAVVEQFDKFGLPLDIPYGSIYRFRRGSFDFAANGAGDDLGVFRSTAFFQDQDGKQKAIFGDTFVALVEFTQPVRAKLVHTYGNSSNPKSPHYGAQLGLAATMSTRTAKLTRNEVEAHLERREEFAR